MKHVAPRITIYLLIMLAALFICAGGYWYATEQAAAARAHLTQTLLQDQQKQISESHIQIAALLAANEEVSAQLKDEAEKRIAAEQSAKLAHTKLTALEQNQEPDLAAVITQWRPRVALVRCELTLPTGVITKSGTATLLEIDSSGNPVLLTNKHVITNKDKVVDACIIRFPDQEKRVSVTNKNIYIPVDVNADWARITLVDAPADLVKLAQAQAARCQMPAAIGSSVIMLGYPSIGTTGDITATEGIISGTEKNYYITSAKVERGNSGGAAILAKQNCYLGIPSFVDAGQIESLARILDQRTIGTE